MVFNALAGDYDVNFAERPVAKWLRERVHERLAVHLKPGARVLDLGCGTGIDALWMAQHGAQVTALDTSPAMLDITRQRLAAYPETIFAPIDFNKLADSGLDGSFDIVLANFGALNMLEDWRPLAEWLIPHVASGGVMCFAVMTRFCLWETVWNFAHLRPRRATRRWSGTSTFNGKTVTYPLAIEVARAFMPEFKLTHKRGLGIFLPPSEMFAVVEKRPWLLKQLIGIDSWFWKNGTGTRIADHAWLEMTRR